MRLKNHEPPEKNKKLDESANDVALLFTSPGTEKTTKKRFNNTGLGAFCL